jgi:molybdopterin converting factor small subunit
MGLAVDRGRRRRIMTLRIVFSGRGYDAAADLPREWEFAEGATLDQVLAAVEARLSATLPASCLIAVGGEHLGTVGRHANRDLREGDEIVLIAPVAGG